MQVRVGLRLYRCEIENQVAMPEAVCEGLRRGRDEHVEILVLLVGHAGTFAERGAAVVDEGAGDKGARSRIVTDGNPRFRGCRGKHCERSGTGEYRPGKSSRSNASHP